LVVKSLLAKKTVLIFVSNDSVRGRAIRGREMNHFLHGVARATIECFNLPEPILEIGSRHVAGQSELIDLRRYFVGKHFEGVDIVAGPGVDRVANVESLPHADQSIGTVLALSTFEHVERFWRGFDEVRRVLRPDGVLLVCTPFYFHIHNFPGDYWRLTPQAMRLMLEPYAQKIVGSVGPPMKPAHVWAVAFREAWPPITADQLARYRALLVRHARMPRRWGRELRYRLGRLLCGSRPFSPFLDQSWRLECHSTISA
jgi:SAM-dependent methyltransferase